MMNRVKEEKQYWDNFSKLKNAQDLLTEEATIEKCMNRLFASDVNFNPKVVLEIGSAIARLTIPVAKELPNAVVVGLDVSDKLIEIAEKNVKKAKVKNIHFELGDGRNIPDGIHNLDFVYSITTFQHITEEGVKGYIQQVGKLLNKRGKFIFQFVEGEEKSAMSQQYNSEQMKEWCEESGLYVYDMVHDIYPNWVFLYASKK